MMGGTLSALLTGRRLFYLKICDMGNVTRTITYSPKREKNWNITWTFSCSSSFITPPSEHKIKFMDEAEVMKYLIDVNNNK